MIYSQVSVAQMCVLVTPEVNLGQTDGHSSSDVHYSRILMTTLLSTSCRTSHTLRTGTRWTYKQEKAELRLLHLLVLLPHSCGPWSCFFLRLHLLQPTQPDVLPRAGEHIQPPFQQSARQVWRAHCSGVRRHQPDSTGLYCLLCS